MIDDYELQQIAVPNFTEDHIGFLAHLREAHGYWGGTELLHLELHGGNLGNPANGHYHPPRHFDELERLEQELASLGHDRALTQAALDRFVREELDTGNVDHGAFSKLIAATYNVDLDIKNALHARLEARYNDAKGAGHYDDNDIHDQAEQAKANRMVRRAS